MPQQDDPAAGIRNFEGKFWSLDGLLHKSAGKNPSGNSGPDPNKASDVIQRQNAALTSFQKRSQEQATPAEHKAAVSKMAPEHVHKLVQDAHSGKYGPDAQKMAQSAMQQQQSSQDNEPSFTVSNADSGNGSDGGGASKDAASIFGGQ